MDDREGDTLGLKLVSFWSFVSSLRAPSIAPSVVLDRLRRCVNVSGER